MLNEFNLSTCKKFVSQFLRYNKLGVSPPRDVHTPPVIDRGLMRHDLIRPQNLRFVQNSLAAFWRVCLNRNIP